MEQHGIVTIDEAGGWTHAMPLDEQATDDILDAIRLTFTHAPMDGSYGRAICGDLRNELAEVLVERGDMRIEEDDDGREEGEVSFTLDPFGGRVGIARMPESWKEAA